ncbi:MAG: carboxymuconolactone decarboxylase family protein [Spirochaetales bacterium]|nr:carboxymuconolactone decarboxylase family protein [Spirochaetales bacterium]
MHSFKKRYLTRPQELFSMITSMRRQAKKIKNVTEEQKINPVLCEKVMLAVSGVTNCVYCSYLHTKNALEKGVRDSEIIKLLNCEFGDFPEQEATAILYGQHWAETGGRPEPGVRTRVAEYYGKEKLNHLETVIHALFMGNMVSNTVEAYRSRVRPNKKRFAFLLVYLLCKPMAFFIRTSGKKGKKFLKNKNISFL